MRIISIATMGCGTSNNRGTVTPSKVASDVQKSAWVKKKGTTTPDSPGKSNAGTGVVINGHANGNASQSSTPSANSNRTVGVAVVGQAASATSDGSSVYSKQDSMGLFDLIGRISTGSNRQSSGEGGDEGVVTWPENSAKVVQGEPEISLVKRGLGPTPDSEDEGSTVNQKLHELQQLLGSSVFCGPIPEMSPPKDKYFVNEKDKKKDKANDVVDDVENKIEKTASVSSGSSQDSAVDASQFPPDLWDGDLERALTDINRATAERRRARRADRSGVANSRETPQTSDQVAKHECLDINLGPKYSPLPPISRRAQLFGGPEAFTYLDQNVAKLPETAATSLLNLVNCLTSFCKTEIEIVRSFFIWIALNMRYDWKYVTKDLKVEEILERKRGVCTHYCKLLSEMCKVANIREKKIRGFAKGFDFRPGYQFQSTEDSTHAWNAVFVEGSWRLIDATWGAGFSDSLGRFQRRLCDHFFLTDPDMFNWTHFPFDETELNFERWQLVANPITLSEFNSRTKVSPYFFEYNLRLPPNSATIPIRFINQTMIMIEGINYMRYKFKFFSAEGSENAFDNKWVFSQFRNNRLTVTFIVVPPEVGHYYLKIYGRPERELDHVQENCALNIVATFYLQCTRSLSPRLLRPHPISDSPWGPTEAFFKFGLTMPPNLHAFVVVPSGRWVTSFEAKQRLVLTLQLFDPDGNNLNQSSDGSKDKTMYASVLQDENSNKIRLAVKPPGLGYYRFLVFAAPQPTRTGKVKLPLVASFLLDIPSREVLAKREKKKKEDVKRQKMLEGYREAIAYERRIAYKQSSDKKEKKRSEKKNG